MRKVLLIFLLSGGLLYSETRVEQVQQAIRSAGAAWYTGQSWVAALSPDEFACLCGTIPAPSADAENRFLRLNAVTALPSRFDWRNADGNWLTPVRNQGSCGSCWDFSAVAQVEAWYQIVNRMPQSGIDLSEQYILSCAGVGDCNGGSIEGALSFIRDVGVPSEKCMPYRANGGIPCGNACPTAGTEAVTIPEWGYVTLNEILIDNLKQAVYRQPVSASYTVYEDFQYYSGGVYQHVWGKAVAGHAVLIVGWDDGEQYWICKNSWGADWGENGYFRIRWGDSGLGAFTPFIYHSKTENAAALSSDSLVVELTAGGQAQAEFSLINRGSVPLEFALFAVATPRVFHVSAFNAYDDFSWWCGSPSLGGYAGHWLQYLDTPAIDLSGTANPQLSFMTYWSIEPPEGADPPWDGWDGANVWISTDSGKSFQVIEPIYPRYTCSSLWAFGEKEQGWNMGPNIPGWAGRSNGWQAALFDLSAYRSPQTVIRFAFASDMGYSTIDDPLIWGFFLDRIAVTDGLRLLFVDEGENSESMRKSGFGSVPAEWLKPSPAIGVVPPLQTEIIALSVSTESLDAGVHQAEIQIECNDRSLDTLRLPVALRVRAAERDLAIFPRSFGSEKLYVGETVRPRALIRNLGSLPSPPVTVHCTIGEEPRPLFIDSLRIGSLAPDEYLRAEFSRCIVPDTGRFTVAFNIDAPVDEARRNNDSATAVFSAVSLVDDFEHGGAAWILQGGWGLTNRYGGRSGSFAAHCNAGTIPYRPNMNAMMTLRKSFAIDRLDSVWVSFNANCHTQLDKDYCLLEISTDSLHWRPAYKFSNENLRYEEHRVSLAKLFRAGDSRLWIRFRFVSDAAEESAGVFIDDVHFYGRVKPLPTTVAETTGRGRPTSRLLLRNYPNPFNDAARIDFRLERDGFVELTVFSLDGRFVERLVKETKPAGEHSLLWKPAGLPSGIYLLHLNVCFAGGGRAVEFGKAVNIK